MGRHVPESVKPDFDAIVIGAGLTGMYQVYRLRGMGFKVKGYEAGSDVGGTWYWNRYPGCRLDTESYTYGYFSHIGLMEDWDWSERFAGQPELLRYVGVAADRMDIRKDFQFNTRVLSAHFDDKAQIWRLTLDDGTHASCRFLITAVGPLSATRMPAIPGIDTFEGESFHSSRWPRDPQGGPEGRKMDFTGKRVGVIGTGATGVQIIPIVAETAGELTVFQRSPNWCTPLGNYPLTADDMARIRKEYPEILAYVKTTPTGFPYHPLDQNGVDATAQERQQFFDKLYSTPGYGIWLGNYKDMLTNRDSNRFLAEFIANKIRERVKDPQVAEKLIPKDHPFGTKRVPMETNYYETYNRENVHLVDIRETPITEITPRGIRTGDTHHDLDVIIYATGFDAVTGALDRIDIRGRNGQRLTDVWQDGPLTYLGLQIVGFPNMFTLVAAHNGASFCNIGVCGGLQVEWVSEMIGYMRDNHLALCEPTSEAQDAWTQSVYADFEATLLPEASAWWVKITDHPDGTQTRRALAYVGGGPEYRELCDEVAADGYRGFTFEKEAQEQATAPA